MSIDFKNDNLQIKICGIMDPVALEAVCDSLHVLGKAADYIGFVFCEPEISRHFLTPAQAQPLVAMVPDYVKSVGLFVNPSDHDLDMYLSKARVDILQLHGTETPLRVEEIKKKFGMPLIKVFHISNMADFDHVSLYNESADAFLFDTKSKAGPSGGTGVTFDWNLLQGQNFARPWFLAGGLNLENLERASFQSHARLFDLSSGAETDKRKDPEKIREIIRTVQKLNALRAKQTFAPTGLNNI